MQPQPDSANSAATIAQRKKLAILIAAAPDSRNFTHATRLAEAALRAGVEVYVYCIDDAVPGVEKPATQSLKENGAHLFACAYGANRRELPLSESAMFAGLGVVHDLASSATRFVCFT